VVRGAWCVRCVGVMFVEGLAWVYVAECGDAGMCLLLVNNSESIKQFYDQTSEVRVAEGQVPVPYPG